MKKRVPSKNPIINGVRQYVDGREVCQETDAGDREYHRRTFAMADRQFNVCALCGHHMFDPTFDHEGGRGAGGGKRDDRIENDQGEWMNAAVHYDCNGEKGSRRFQWVGGEYRYIQ